MKAGRSENGWDQYSHHCWFTKLCSIIWVAHATNSWLRPNLWTWTGSSTRETNAFHQRPQERKNPYISKYGERWVEKLKSSSSMSKLSCITDLIWFMMKEAEKLIKGSVREDNLFIVHDVLLLMTANETIKWMKEKNWFHRWLLPMNGFQEGTPYAGSFNRNIFLDIWREMDR